MAIFQLPLLLLNRFTPGRDRRDSISYGDSPLMTYDEFPSKLGTAPLVIFWHGGSWKNGQKERNRFVGHTLQKMGVHAFVVDYPKYPQQVFPGFLDDAVLAIKHIISQYPQRKVVLMGHSAGGHTALMVALKDMAQVNAVVAFSAPCTIREKYWRPVFGDTIRNGQHDPRNFADSSPTSLSTLLIHGTFDATVSVNDSVSLDKKLRASKRDSQLMKLKFVDHLLILPLAMLGALPRAHKRLKQFLLV